MDLESYWWQLDAWSRRSARLLCLQQESVYGTWVTHNAWLRERLYTAKNSPQAGTLLPCLANPPLHSCRLQEQRHQARFSSCSWFKSPPSHDSCHPCWLSCVTFFPWWHSHTVTWQNPYLPNGGWPGHCRTLSRLWEGDVLGTTLVFLGKNSARDALACLCCRCFAFTQPNPINLLSTQL